MALDGTYTGLKASVADWLNRADLSAQIPDFITLGEAMNNRELRTVQMEGFDTGTSSDGLVAVPTDWLETRTLRLDAPSVGQQILEYVGEEEMDQLEANGLTGTTRYYTNMNGVFQVLPLPSAPITYDLRYYQAIPALSASNQSNWLLTKSPDLYLLLVPSGSYRVPEGRRPPADMGRSTQCHRAGDADGERTGKAQHHTSPHQNGDLRMSVVYSLTAKNSRMQVIANLMHTFVIGTNTLSGANGILATTILAATPGVVTNGVLTILNVPITTAGVATGLASLAELRDSSGNTVASGLAVATTGAEVIISNPNIVLGQTVTLNSGTITHG